MGEGGACGHREGGVSEWERVELVGGGKVGLVSGRGWSLWVEGRWG